MNKTFFILPAAALCLAGATARAGEIEIVESWPVETILDSKDLRDTGEVWLEMIGGARKTLDIATFYVTSEKGEPLEPVLQAIRDAAARGVKVRIISDKKFQGIYPEPLGALNKEKNIEVRIIDMGLFGGGVMHAKYFIVDGRQLFLGSANFDWRSLKHIRELGLRIADQKLAAIAADLFALDWRLAEAKDAAAGKMLIEQKSYAVPLKIAEAEVTPVFSPQGWHADSALFEEDRLIGMLDSAKKDILLQVLSYSPVTRGGEFYGRLDNALRRAAVRGVRVKLIVADWSKSAPQIDHLKSLAVLPNIEIKLSTIPPWSEGFVPFGRVQHAKLLVIDSGAFWLGTGNWSKDYFYNSRNFGLIIKDKNLTSRLRKVFFTDWMGPYTEFVEAGKDYIAPQVGD
ncbi:MAG: phospholipase D-like domain-containing protein [Elusimicrobiota bacterium]